MTQGSDRYGKPLFYRKENVQNMGGMTVDDGDNIIIKNNGKIGLTIKPDGSILTPNGGGGVNRFMPIKT